MVSFFRLPLCMAALALLATAQPPLFRAQSPEPAVPPDPLELVTGEAQPVQNADQRAAVTKLLVRAYTISNVRPYPYDRKTVFTTFGSTSSDGSWQLEDMSSGSGFYRWNAQGPGYSAVNLYDHQMLYSNRPAVSIPVRLAQVRSAIFFMRPFIGPRATLRTAAASFNGASLTCILLSYMGAAKGATGGRHWSEAEYCIDTASGALITYSAAPGIYTLYDYSQAVHFRDLLVPNKFTITEAGRTVIEAQTVSVADPPKDPSLFQTAGLSQIGLGSLMTAPAIFRSFVPVPNASPRSAQIAVLHGMRSGTGQITDAELLASSDSAVNQTALQVASQWQGRGEQDDVEPGATPQSHEILMTLTFIGIQR